MAEWGTPIRMLGRTGGGCLPCAAASGVGNAYSRALPAGTLGGTGGFQGLGAAPEGMGPLPWASYPGSGGPNRVVTDVGGASPQWLRNTITMPVISPDDPQNRQRVFNGGLFDPSWDPRTGQAIRGYSIAGLGNLVRPWEGSASSFTMGTRGLGKTLRGGLSALSWDVGGWRIAPGPVNLLGGLLLGVHGYARNKNVGWGLGWALAGFAFPFFTGAIAVVQGLGKSKSSGG